jgi:putative transposase
VITSDGDKVSNPKHFTKHYQRLRKDTKKPF